VLFSFADLLKLLLLYVRVEEVQPCMGRSKRMLSEEERKRKLRLKRGERN